MGSKRIRARLLAPPPPRAFPTDLDRVGSPGWNRARHGTGGPRLARRRQLEPPVRRGHGTDRAGVPSRQWLANLRVMRGRGQDRANGVEEVSKRKTADLASFVGEPPALLVQPRPTQDLHPTRTTLVGCRRRNDTSWVKILRL